MELRQLATFVAVAEEGSFTRASDRLQTVQSAVSAGVRNLERDLGARLFDRSTHKVKLTDAGRALLPAARATLAAATAARDAVDAVRGGVRGTVVLGAMQGQAMGAIDVAGVLADFRKDHPAVEVHIRQAGSSEMAAHVREGRLDLAFVSLPGPEVPGIELTPLGREPIVLVTPAAHPLATGRTVELVALAAEPMVEFPPGWGIRMANDRAFAAAGLTRSIAYEVNDAAGLIGFVRHGLAVSMLPASLVDDTAGLAFIPVRGQRPEFLTQIATPTNRRLTAGARALLETIKQRNTSS